MKKALTALFVSLCLANYAQNLVVNPGFENGLTGWITNTDAPLYVTIQADSTVVHMGNSSLRIQVNNDSAGGFGLVTEYFFLQPGGHYLLSWFIKTDSIANGSAFPYTILLVDGARYYGEAGYAVDETNNGWQQYNYRFYTPQNADTVQLLLALGASNGKAWFDDISLTALTDTTYAQLRVAVDSVTGTTIQPFTSTNVGPIDPTVSTLNLTPQFEQLGMEYVRTHDYEGPCDMHVIFPDTTRSAFDSTAYDFTMTDSVIKATIAAGSKIYFRLGESGNPDTSLYDVPRDMNKWAQVAAHIMQHFNHGWDKGFNFDINYWEIYNEPDLGWNGTINQYIELYRLTSTALRAADSTLMIGGPAISSLTNTDFLYSFLDSVYAESLPFNFLSYHYYHTFNPYDFERYDNFAKQILTQHGLGNVERIVSEWSNYNYNPGNNYFVWRNDPYIAASSAAALTYYQNTDVFKLLRYRTDGTDLGMFDAGGNYNFTGLAYYFMSNFKNAPLRLQTTGGDTLGTAILAGQDLNGGLAAILVADNCSSANGYILAINGISATDRYNYSIFRIDSNVSSTPVDSGIVTAINNRISVPVKPPYTDFIVMTKSVFTGTNEVAAALGINAYPNPFLDKVTIRYGGNAETIEGIDITDMLGRRVKTFSAEECRAGNHVEWDGLTGNNQKVAPGIYFVRLQTDKTIYEITLVRME
jgi:xylan 1,4-beta-xylosidase